jgi:hypothetical protein
MATHHFSFLSSQTIVTHLSTTQEGDEVWKNGRQTGLTCGRRFSHIKSHSYARAKPYRERLWNKSTRQHGHYVSFGVNGDLGAWTLNDLGRLCDLWFSGSDDGSLAYSWTPITTVIQERAGRTARPRRRLTRRTVPQGRNVDMGEREGVNVLRAQVFSFGEETLIHTFALRVY